MVYFIPNISRAWVNTLYPILSIKNCLSEIKYPNILYTQKPWLTLMKGGNTFHEKQKVGLVRRVTQIAGSPS